MLVTAKVGLIKRFVNIVWGLLRHVKSKVMSLGKVGVAIV